ncbi:fatty acid amide hydrolase-like isoform X5 [Mercurialis annua]|uniref:fatty acid amide hydrolase-like isoform X5 n=1 Tax=Mercurialis annua TaxID=3986 RepID=UPI0024AD38FA|nr:fatty acid amide hydrolase-like isoform X5 [Mercurialis annua]
MGLLKAEGVIYKATEKVDLSADSHEPYQRANVKAPRMAGFVLKMFAWFLESNIFGPFLLYILKRNNLIHKLVSNAELEESPLYVPLHPFAEDFSEKEENENLSPSQRVQKAVQCLPPSLSSSSSSNLSFRRYSIMDYFNAYNSAQITPFMVAKRIIGAIGESCDPSLDMAFFINYDIQDILRQAEESTQRYQKGEPLSVLDGVPIAVKDEIDCTPYPTTGGTKWLHLLRSCKSDAYCVMCLRSCGAMLIGKTNMHELGAGTSGINPHYGATRNPYDAGKIAGGSSSGSAAVVAAGLCPVALGVDGGDVWGPTISPSIHGHKYYLLFVDHFTKYVWLYPLQAKSEVAAIFPLFQALVEKQFNSQIRNFYSDNGGEFVALRHYFATKGISWYTTAPHTPQQNGTAERRHRQLLAIGRALLSHSGLPIKYWSYAIETAAYLYNRMPTSLLNDRCPYEALFQKSPNYAKLRVFGCLCFPWLKQSQSQKSVPQFKI